MKIRQWQIKECSSLTLPNIATAIVTPPPGSVTPPPAPPDIDTTTPPAPDIDTTTPPAPDTTTTPPLQLRARDEARQRTIAIYRRAAEDWVGFARNELRRRTAREDLRNLEIEIQEANDVIADATPAPPPDTQGLDAAMQRLREWAALLEEAQTRENEEQLRRQQEEAEAAAREVARQQQEEADRWLRIQNWYADYMTRNTSPEVRQWWLRERLRRLRPHDNNQEFDQYAGLDLNPSWVNPIAPPVRRVIPTPPTFPVAREARVDEYASNVHNSGEPMDPHGTHSSWALRRRRGESANIYNRLTDDELRRLQDREREHTEETAAIRQRFQQTMQQIRDLGYRLPGSLTNRVRRRHNNSLGRPAPEPFPDMPPLDMTIRERPVTRSRPSYLLHADDELVKSN